MLKITLRNLYWFFIPKLNGAITCLEPYAKRSLGLTPTNSAFWHKAPSLRLVGLQMIQAAPE